MRNFIIGLSILIFALSGLITFKALRISVKSNSYNNDSIFIESKDIPYNVKNISGKDSKDQASHRALIDELQATITKLENELSNINEHTQAKEKTMEKKLNMKPWNN